jgi:2-polyprenyl-3-methyl-5-hydroxy-6-metoxy-1,4-benzoquinol methylase
MYPVLSEISRRRKLKLIVDHCRPQDAILEVGAGSGWLAARLRERGYQVTTLDLVAPADVVGDVCRWQQLGLPAAAFDAIVALELIEHTDCLEALKCLCKPGGLIMLSSPHPRWDWVMKVLEGLRLTQRRTSPHDHLTDFRTIKLPHIHYRRPGLIHQVAIFVNRPLA